MSLDVLIGWMASEWLNLLCLVWFSLLWIGYSYYAKYKAPHTECLALVMHHHRMDWMKSVVSRDVRVADASIIANIERNVSFMASTSMLVLAGLVTVLVRSGELHQLLSSLPLVTDARSSAVQLKLLVMAGIFIYAFFTFTWSLRQFGFGSILLGAMPVKSEASLSEEDCDRYAESAGKVLDKAAHSYNYGLRSFYFAMAVLAWFIHPILFMAAVALVVAVLYHREFHSSTLTALLQVNADWHAGSAKLTKAKGLEASVSKNNVSKNSGSENTASENIGSENKAPERKAPSGSTEQV